MTRSFFLAATCLGLALPAGAQDGAAPADAAAFLARADAQWGMFNEYCVECHNFEDWAGGVAFDTVSAETVPEERELFEHVVRKLRGGLMPPPGEPRPDAARQAEFVAWLEGYLDAVGAAEPSPGYVPLHRLNRKEYENAVRDLLDLEVNGAELLPADTSVDGFDNLAEGLQITPAFLEQSILAARAVAVQAVGNPASRPGGETYYAPVNGRFTSAQSQHVDGLPLGTRGGAVVDHYFPSDGEYRLSIAPLAQALWVEDLEHISTLVAVLDGKRIFEVDIGGGEDLRAIDQVGDPAVDAINARLVDIPFQATAGLHRIGVTFIQPSYAEDEGPLSPVVPGGGNHSALHLKSFQVVGPFNPTGLSETPSRARIFSCYPQNVEEEDPCAREIFSTLSERAFRGEAHEEDFAQIWAAYEQGKVLDGGFEGGVRRGLTVILAHPRFLFRALPADEELAPGESYRLSDLELASRLSFFLWSSVPDDELRNVAEEGRLRDEGVLEAQVRRMLADPRSETLASNFAFQWLHLARLDEVVPDPALFPDVESSIRDDMRTELAMFIDSIFREDRPVTDLFTADHTYLNEALAQHYGIPTVRGDHFQRVTLEDSARWGLLGKGAVLMSTAYPNRTAPVLRGAWIMENLLGAPPPDPPPGVEAIQENVVGQGVFLSVKEQMEIHRSDPTCNSCHGVMDPLGMALETFDATGRWQDIDRFARVEIDAAGELPDGRPLDGPNDLREALMEHPDVLVQTLVEKLMIYALGRPVVTEDMPTVRAITRGSAEQGYAFSSIVLAIVGSDEFQSRSAPPAGLVQEASLEQ